MASKSIVFILSLLALLSLQTVNGFTLELTHPNSPANPLRNPSKTRFDWIREAYNHTCSRAAAIQSRLGGASSKFRTSFNPVGGGGAYVMKYSIGTPPFDTYGCVDTGSDFTWTQCHPCIHCYQQGMPIFDPENSASYLSAACGSEECNMVPNAYCSGDNACLYEVMYEDESKSSGEVAIDNLTLGDASFQNVVFGCGHENNDLFDPGYSGIVGLANSELSIVKQLDEQIGGKFAYCMSSDPTSQSHISFGPDALVQGPQAVSTPFYINSNTADLYWLLLTDISINGDTILQVKQPSTSNSPGNIVIDSGTTLTMLPSYIADALALALARNIPWFPVITDPQGMFKLCYSIDDEFTVPNLTFHFYGGAAVLLSPKGMFYNLVTEGIKCLTIVSDTISDGISIFGYLSQVDHLIGHDLVAQTVTFMPADCSTY